MAGSVVTMRLFSWIQTSRPRGRVGKASQRGDRRTRGHVAARRRLLARRCGRRGPGAGGRAAGWAAGRPGARASGLPGGIAAHTASSPERLSGRWNGETACSWLCAGRKTLTGPRGRKPSELCRFPAFCTSDFCGEARGGLPAGRSRHTGRRRANVGACGGLRAAGGSNRIVVLQDESGGRGIDCIARWPDVATRAGFAGGIGPGNVARAVHHVQRQPEGSWIDMESGVRTAGWFDVGLVIRTIWRAGWAQG